MTASFSAAWMRGDPRALSFLPDAYRHRSARAEAVAAAATRSVSAALHAALVERNARLPASPARERHLELLARPGTVAVVTGQQVGLFLGPLFTVYKAASAVVAARALSEETGRPCVPVFWLQTEDHDLPEVDHCLVPRAEGEPLRVALSHPDAAASRVPVSQARLGEGVRAALAALRVELGEQPHAGELLALLERAYRPEATLPEAFAEVLSSLFADEGLVVLDPRDAPLGALAAPLHRRGLEEAEAIASALAARGAALAREGFSEQVHLRPGAPLSFVSPEGVDGPRYRLERGAAGDTWSLVGHPEGATVRTSQLRDWLAQEPRRFTTSALLRPLLQDEWLPTAAYVGGPGEVAYFAQLAPLYAHLGLPMPLVVPRARFRVLEARTRSLLTTLGLTADEAAAPRDTVLARLADREGAGGQESPAALEARLAGPLLAELSRLSAQLPALDPGLSRALRRTEGTVRRAVSRLAGRYGRVLAEADRVRVQRVERLQAALTPGGAPQERVYGLLAYAARHGARAFVQQVLRECEPFSGALKDLTP